MKVDQTNYVQEVDRVEVDRVTPKNGSTLVRIRIKGANEEDSLSFSLWGAWDRDTLEHAPVKVIVTEVDEHEPEVEPVEEDADV